MPMSRGDGHNDRDRRLFRKGADPDSDPHLADLIRPHYGAYPTAPGTGPRGSDRCIPDPGRVDLERHEDAINRKPLLVLHVYDHSGVLPLEHRLWSFQRDTIARRGWRLGPTKKHRHADGD